jgi:gamma-glutamylcyclotransferase (GGCT)/AIG2-like uncharacterized protein YtfP
VGEGIVSEKMQLNKLFIYGILKRGYELDLAQMGGKFIGEARIEGATLYGIGRLVGVQPDLPQYRGVGLRLEKDPRGGILECGHAYSQHSYLGNDYSLCDDCEKEDLNKGYQEDIGICYCKEPKVNVAHGELWDVTGLWDWLDGIEANGFTYTRKIVDVKLATYPAGAPYDSDAYVTVRAWVYEHTYPGFKYENPIPEGRF